jgi:hypothetical protein
MFPVCGTATIQAGAFGTRPWTLSVVVCYLHSFMYDVPATEHYADDRVQLTYQIVARDHRQGGLYSGTGCGTWKSEV